MKTWQIIKALTENPNLKFESPIPGHIVMLNPDTKQIQWCINGRFERFVLIYDPGCADNLRDIEWKLVQKPVTWQEAIQAWLDGKGFRVEMPDGAIITQDKAHVLGYYSVVQGIKDRSRIPGFDKDLFRDGKWFVEGE